MSDASDSRFDDGLDYIVPGELLNRILSELDGGRSGSDEERELRELARSVAPLHPPTEDVDDIDGPEYAGRMWDQKGPS